MAGDILAVPRYLMGIHSFGANCVVEPNGRVNSKLSARIGAKPGALSQMLPTLVERNLIRVDPHLEPRIPKRTYVIMLTLPAVRLIDRMRGLGLALDDFIDAERAPRTREVLRSANMGKSFQRVWPLESQAFDVTLLEASSVTEEEVTAGESTSDCSDSSGALVESSKATLPQLDVLPSGDIFIFQHHNEDVVRIVRYLAERKGYLGVNQGDHLSRIADDLEIEKHKVDNLLRMLAREGVIRRQVKNGKTIEVAVMSQITKRPPNTEDPAEVETALLPGIDRFKVNSEKQIYRAIINYLREHGKQEHSSGDDVMTRLCTAASEVVRGRVTEGDVWRVLSRAEEIKAIVMTGRRKWINTLELGPMLGGQEAVAPPPQGEFQLSGPLPGDVVQDDGDKLQGEGQLDTPALPALPIEEPPTEVPDPEDVVDEAAAPAEAPVEVVAESAPLEPDPIRESSSEATPEPEPEPALPPAATVTPIDVSVQAKPPVTQPPRTIELPLRAAETTVNDLNHAAMFELLHQIEANRVLAGRNAELEDELAEVTARLAAAERQIQELRSSGDQLAS